MSDPKVYEIGDVVDFDEIEVHVGVDYNLVTIHVGRWVSGGGIRLSRDAAEKFAELFIAGCWRAGRQDADGL